MNVPVLSRRSAVVTLLTIPVALAWGSESPAQTTGILTELARAMGAAAGGVKSIGDSIAAQFSRRRMSRQEARRLGERLTTLSSRLESLYVAQTDLVEGLDAYYNLWGPADYRGARRYRTSSEEDRLERRSRHWSAVAETTSHLLGNVSRLLQAVQAERSEFVSQGAYWDLRRALSGRVTLLSRLRRTSPPDSPAEFAALQQVILRYDELRGMLRRGITLSDQYIQSLPS